MIGMMYLVLTAMLALNVSAAILNGYIAVDDSLHATISATEESNGEAYAQFEAALSQNAEKTQTWYDKAMQVKQTSDAFYEYVQNFKDEMVAIADGADAKKNATLRDVKKQDDTNVPQQYAIEEGNAAKLKDKIHAYRDFMIDITGESPALDKEFMQTFHTPRGTNTSGDSISWEESLFHEMPMCACISVLTKLQNDIRHSEGRAVRYLLTQTDAGDLRVNKFSAHIIPSAKYIMKGQKYSAQILFAAIDSTQALEYYVNGQKLNSNGVYEIVANSVGMQKIKGQIGYMDQQGVMQYLPFEDEYTVGEPAATISNTELNIIYRGHPNPFSISVPGVSANLLQVKCAHASVTRENNSWVIIPPKNSPDKVTIEVYANMNGNLMAMGSQEYRVRDLPAPTAYFEIDGVPTDSEKISFVKLRNPKNKFIASYGADGLIQAKFEIVSFQVRLPSGTSIQVNGNQFNKRALDAIGKLQLGSIITIMSIKAKAADGTERPLRSLTIEL
ncbi:MAG: gliding motility protein GldM [Paludibacteraceae bacterium]|nr:gliding motility protein GldM [Paludibacteraceae bacterium]